MATQAIYHLALITHITGFTMIAGAVLVDYVITKQFWKQYTGSRQKEPAADQPMSVFPMLFSLGIYVPVLFGVGMLLQLISGIGMATMVRNVFFEQLWLQVKMVLVVFIIVNGLAVGKRQGKKLKGLLIEETSGGNVGAEISRVKRNIHWFHVSQLILLVTVLVLSVFKFD